MQKLTTTVITILLSCISVQVLSQDILLKERDLIPEGIAFDQKTKSIYVSSMHKRKIIAIDQRGNIRNFVAEAFQGIGSVAGMEVDTKQKHLWATSNFGRLPLKQPDANKTFRAEVVCFDLRNGNLLNRFAIAGDSCFANDLTVLKNGDVFVTESVHSKVYLIKKGEMEAKVFLKLTGFDFANGIVSDKAEKYLFIATTQGIIKMNIATRQFQKLSVPDSINDKGIDGLALYKNVLVGHQSTKVTLFYLNETQTAIIKTEVFDTGAEFDSSTTGELDGVNYYYIVNSQIRSGVDYAALKIKPYDTLKDIIVRKKTIGFIRSR